MQKVSLAMEKMRKEADVKDIMGIYREVRKEISNRDLLYYNEMTSKSIFSTLLFVDNVYILESEKENNEGYSDLYLKEGITYKEEVRYRYLIEFKHIKEGDYTEKNLETTKSEAAGQLERYIKDKKIIEESEKPLKKMMVIRRQYSQTGHPLIRAEVNPHQDNPLALCSVFIRIFLFFNLKDRCCGTLVAF